MDFKETNDCKQEDDLYQKSIRYGLRLIIKKRYSVKKMTDKVRGFLERTLQKSSDANNVNEIYIDVVLKKVIARLKELGYLNDEEFVRNYVSDRMNFRPRGEYKLRIELFKKGIGKAVVDDFFEKNSFDELEAALSCFEKYQKKIVNYDYNKKRERIFRYLAGKGFRPDIIYKVLEKW